MKLFYRSLSSFFILLFSISSLHAKELLSNDQMILQGVEATAETYPDSDTVLLDDFIQVAYQPDGTYEMWDDTAVKILTEKGKRASRVLTLYFNVSYGTNYFTKVEIIKPSGTIVPVNIQANTKIMVDPDQMNANIYNPNSKVLNLSVPGLEIGDTLHYIAYDQTTKTVVPNTWSDYQTFESDHPIQHMTYQVIAPTNRPLKKIALKAEIPGTVVFDEKTNAANITYTWRIQNVPRMFEEPNMPEQNTVVQRLLVSTIDTWEELSTWYWELCQPRFATATPEMQTKANELTANCGSTEEKIKAIFNFVSQEIRYMGITPEEEAPGYEPHDVNITFENRYGVCRDKAALLAAMLRLVDIEAFPVIIMAGPKKDEEVPQPFFNHAVTAALGDDGKYILMDSTDENTKDIFPAYLQNMSFLVARPEGETLLTSPTIPATSNLLQIATTASLDNAGTLQAESTLTFEGVNDTVYRGYFSRIKPEERRRFFEGHLKHNIPTAELNAFEILPHELRDTTQPMVVKLSYSANNLLIEGNNNKMFKLPRLGRTLGYANFLLGQTGLETRKYPLYTSITAGIREVQNVELPEEIGNVNVPDYQTIDTPPLSWNIQMTQHDQTLRATNLFLLNTVEFSPEEYLQLKQNLKEIEYNLRKSLVIDSPAADPNSDAGIRILDQITTINLDSTEKWVKNRRTKIKILTYAGKKEYSEIKIPYNSAWKTVRIKSATVTQPDGSVKAITEDEINQMDAAWVATAPRYPAERILVASLPGVEIGSVLDIETVTEVNGMPFFSMMEFFTAHEPIDHKQLILTAPKTLDLKIRNTDVAETRKENGSTVTYTWTITDQPAVKEEESLPSWWTFNPTIMLSTGSWEEYSETVLKHLKDAAENQPKTEALAEQLINGIGNRKERARTLRDWVAENLRAAGPGLPQLPLSSITPADQTLADRYGNNTDRMVVLYTLLEDARFHPEFVLSGDIPLISEAAKPLLEVPYREAFGRVLIKIEVDNEVLYLDASSQYAEPGTSAFDHHAMLNLRSGALSTIHIVPGKDDRSHLHYEMNIAPDGEIGLTQTATMQGTSFDSFHRTYAEMTPENRRRHYLEIITGISQSAQATSALITDYTSYPGKMAFSLHAPHYGVQDGNYLYFTIPGNGLGTLLKYRSNERTLPLAWNSYIDVLFEYIILLPEGYEPAIMPKNYSWKAPQGAGMVEISVEYSPLANAIRIVQVANIRPALIPSESFPEIIIAGRKLAHPDMSTILLRKTK